MEFAPLKWNNLTLIERLGLIKHNSKLDTYIINGERFAVNAFVKCKANSLIRYITKQDKYSETFEDDGKVSGCKPSPFCHYSNYEMI